MKKIIIILVLLPFLSFSQKRNLNFKLTGDVRKVAGKIEWVYFRFWENGIKMDSVKPQNGKYVFRGKTDEPQKTYLRIKYAGHANPRGWSALYIMVVGSPKDRTSIFIENGNIKVTSIDSFSNIVVKGSTAQKEFEKLIKAEKPFNEKLEVLYSKWKNFYENKDKANLAKTDAEMEVLTNEKNEAVYGNYVKNSPESPIALYAVKQLAGVNIVPEKVEPFFNLLPPQTQSWPSGIELKEQIEIAKKTGIGKEAMEFTQNDTLGVPVSLSSFRGKYILVDFWASWCTPCREENPNLVNAIQKYKVKGFHILGVSLDREGQKDKWLKAIHDDKLDWTHVSDLKYWKNEVAVMYGIKSIPQNLLINPQGLIIGKNLRGEELDKKLGEIIVEGKKAF